MILQPSVRKQYLLDLPFELLLQILSLLHYRDLLECCSVCKSLHLTVSCTSTLQYHIELGRDGLTDEGSLNLHSSSAHCLALLRHRRNAWARIQWTNRVCVPVSGVCQAYELVGGVFAKTMNGGRHFVAQWLPNRRDAEDPGRAEKMVVREDLGIGTKDFAIDPSQDLVAFVEANHGPNPILRIHLRTLSTNTPHPSAHTPVLTLPPSHSLSGNSLSFVQIVDDVIGMFLFQTGPHLVIWSWKAGIRLVDCAANALPPDTWDFSFLSSRAYILTNTHAPGSINIFSFSFPDPSSPSSFHPSYQPPPPILHASLDLPPLQPAFHPLQLSTHTGPFTAKPDPSAPFSTRVQNRVHVVSVRYGRADGFGGGGEGPRYLFFFHNRMALSYVNEDWNGEDARDIPWAEWGPENTRFLAHHIPFMWLRYVHGTRVICPPLHLGPPDKHMMQLLDFNIAPYFSLASPSSVHTNRVTLPDGFAAPAPDGVSDTHLILHASRIAPGYVFAAEVVTRLPYYTVSRVDEKRYEGYMIDEERIVGLESTAFSDGDMRDIDVLTF